MYRLFLFGRKINMAVSSDSAVYRIHTLTFNWIQGTKKVSFEITVQMSYKIFNEITVTYDI